ncbi:MAG: C40 family peptidase [Acidobacteriales bacterium]|nr:C40 family peptidase [Terriglobales bacterium]
MMKLPILATIALSGVIWMQAQVSVTEPKPPESLNNPAATTTGTNSTARQRPLSRQEGAALRDFALAQPSDLDPKPDCSHLMHQIFTEAGLEYPYANSFDLYLGIPQFRRVKNAQPGDLIVWRGHVGLVVQPGERSFYSSLGSGIQTDEYDNRYWRKRGTPRFYRYLTSGSDKATLLAARVRSPQPPATSRTPLQPAESELDTRATVDRSVTPGTEDTDEALVSDNSAPPSALERSRVPDSIPIVTSGATPTREEVAQALSELTNASGGVLRRPNFGQMARPIVIFDQLTVEKVKTKRSEGWAEVRVKWRLQLDQGKTKKSTRSEKLRWQLRFNDQGWQVLAIPHRIYVPADVSVQVLAEKLAALSRDNDERDEQGKLASLLNTMLNDR